MDLLEEFEKKILGPNVVNFFQFLKMYIFLKKGNIPFYFYFFHFGEILHPKKH
jgi:hypothetical protein